MQRFALLVVFTALVSGCVERHADTEYISYYGTPGGGGGGGGGGQDATGSGEDAVIVNDTGSVSPDILADSPFVSCLKLNCPVPLAACALNQSCLGIVACLNKCPSNDTACNATCYPFAGGNPAFEALYTCASSFCVP